MKHAPKKFEFTVSFDGDDHEEVRLKKIQQEQNEWFEKGKNEGIIEGIQKGYNDAQVSIEAQASQVLQGINTQLTRFFSQLESISKEHTKLTLQLFETIAQKLFLKATDIEAVQIIEKALLEAFNILIEEPHIAIHVEPSLLDPLSKRVNENLKTSAFIDRVHFIPDEKMQKAQCLLDWQKGQIEINPEEVWQKIQQVIQNYEIRLNELKINPEKSENS